tara:strand:+ start:8168 stop:8548 length:381 start_codon:yes stop_codon:yes gene_type:complete
MKFKYFTYKEFDCNSGEGKGVDNMNESFICMLDDARERAGIPFNITSGYRTPEYNKALMEQGYKTSKDSSHTKGIAADISTLNSTSRYKILDALLKTGFNRIGIGNTFIHCDTDINKIQNVTWTYY